MFSVMPALVAGIHVFAALQTTKTWMAGTSPAMTKHVHCDPQESKPRQLSNTPRRRHARIQQIAARSWRGG
jgi:hypothetical protein